MENEKSYELPGFSKIRNKEKKYKNKSSSFNRIGLETIKKNVWFPQKIWLRLFIQNEYSSYMPKQVVEHRYAQHSPAAAESKVPATEQYHT